MTSDASLPTTTSTTQEIWLTGFNFSIPTGSTINGITASWRGKNSQPSSPAYPVELTVQLLKAGSKVGSNKSTNGTIPDFYTTKTYGSTSDLWGTTWTAAEVNASTFGIAWAAQGATSMSSLSVQGDYITITVNYFSPNTNIVDGKFGKSRNFNGSSDYIQATSFTNITGSYTFSAWVNPSTVAAGPAIVTGKQIGRAHV